MNNCIWPGKKWAYVCLDLWHDKSDNTHLIPRFFGKLYFSSYEKLVEMCNWINRDPDFSVIYRELVNEDFDDWDFVPDNY